MLKDVIARIEQSRLYRQLRTLVRVATGNSGGRNDEALDLFLTGGYSVQKVSALLLPGIGGPELVRSQMRIQEDIRVYVLSLEKTIADLKEAQRQAQLQALADAAQQAQPTAPAAAPDLLDQLLSAA